MRIRRRSCLGVAILTSAFAVDRVISLQVNIAKPLSNNVLQSDSMKKKETVSFSHVHLYVDKVEDLGVYKVLEAQLNDFSVKAKSVEGGSGSSQEALSRKQDLWASITGNAPDPSPFEPHGRDVVRQLLSGFGFRVTAARYSDQDVPANTRTVLVTSRDPQGVQILVTATDPTSSVDKDPVGMLDARNVKRFVAAHAERQGVGVLAFVVEDVESILNSYKTLHPNLVADYYAEDKTLEVYAYYCRHSEDDDPSNRVADEGTVLRFVQKSDSSPFIIPGLAPVDATFEDSSKPAYCDHWVSNVFSRTEFLDTLEDCLGFSPKVDFNAGVVAGE
jgi:hypothetical protein